MTTKKIPLNMKHKVKAIITNVSETKTEVWLYLGSGGDGKHKSGHSGTTEVQQTTLKRER